MTAGERWRLLVVRWRLGGLEMQYIEARRKRYRVAKREGYLLKLLDYWESDPPHP